MSATTTVKYLDSLCILYCQSSLCTDTSSRNPPLTTSLVQRWVEVQIVLSRTAILRNMFLFLKNWNILIARIGPPVFRRNSHVARCFWKPVSLSETNASQIITDCFSLGFLRSGATWNSMMLTMVFFYPQILFELEDFGSPPLWKTESLQGENQFSSSSV